MPRFPLLLALVLLLGAFSTANAQMVQAQAWVVGKMISNPSETREEFVWRVASFVQQWTDKNNAEVCGYLASNDTGWGIILTTQKSQVMCISDKSVVPHGFVAESENIHSHPTPDEHGMIHVTLETRQMNRALREENKWRKIRVGENFSQDDYKVGAGYLVMSNRLWHQKGKGTARNLGEIPSSI